MLRASRQKSRIPCVTLEAKAPSSRRCSTVNPRSRSALATRFEIVVLPLPSIPSKTTNIVPTSRSDEGRQCKERGLRNGRRQAVRLAARLGAVAERGHPHPKLGEALRGLQRFEGRSQPERHLAAVFDLQDPGRKRGDHLALARRRQGARLADRLRLAEGQILVQRDANTACF